MSYEDLYARLSEAFSETFTDVRGGVEITYLTGEQVTSRLNEVLGVGGWNFRVIEHGVHPEADEIWVLGELTARIGDHDEIVVTKQQFGSQKVKRARSTGIPLDIGFDLKGAGTDALKKCASMLGVGLYLSKKKPAGTTQQRRSQTTTQQRPATATRPAPAATANNSKSSDPARLLEDWKKVSDQATEAGIAHKELPDGAPADQIVRWTDALRKQIPSPAANGTSGSAA